MFEINYGNFKEYSYLFKIFNSINNYFLILYLKPFVNFFLNFIIIIIKIIVTICQGLRTYNNELKLSIGKMITHHCLANQAANVI